MASMIKIHTCFITIIAFIIIHTVIAVMHLEAQLSRPEDPTALRPKDTVSIYLDFTEANLGHSPYRRLRLELELSALQSYRSYPVAEPTGWSTAVFVSSSTEQKLRLGKLPISQYIRSHGGIYYLDYKDIRIAFGLEVPPETVFAIIAKAYENLPEIRESVTERYRSGYTVRIYEAENVLQPDQQQIDYPEAIMAATIIGDLEQWLWGIHDGRDLLNQPLRE